MVFIVGFEKCVADTYILGIIVYKFSHRQEPSSVVLFLVNKNLKIYSYYLIMSLYLAIYLKIQGGKEFSPNTKEVI